MYLALRDYIGQYKSVATNCQIVVVSFSFNFGCQNPSCDEDLKKNSFECKYRFVLECSIVSVKSVYVIQFITRTIINSKKLIFYPHG